jgi:hypothetical protein
MRPGARDKDAIKTVSGRRHLRQHGLQVLHVALEDDLVPAFKVRLTRSSHMGVLWVNNAAARCYRLVDRNLPNRFYRVYTLLCFETWTFCSQKVQVSKQPHYNILHSVASMIDSKTVRCNIESFWIFDFFINT